MTKAIHTYLDISTSHVLESTMNYLTDFTAAERMNLSWPAMTVAAYSYGAFVTVPTDYSRFGYLPTDLEALLLYCQNLGVTLLRLDADAPVLSSLTTYDWE